MTKRKDNNYFIVTHNFPVYAETNQNFFKISQHIFHGQKRKKKKRKKKERKKRKRKKVATM